jgi:hypothetical protein
MIEIYGSEIFNIPMNIRFLETDLLRHQLYNVTRFYDLVDHLKTKEINRITEKTILTSTYYNDFLTAAEYDINTINKIQDQIRKNIVAVWNKGETEIMDIYKTDYDEDFALENPMCYDLNGILYPSLVIGDNMMGDAVNNPIVKVSVNNSAVSTYFGKQWGAYLEGEENSEDGIRECDINTAFRSGNIFEVEAVTLEDVADGIINFQNVVKEGIVLKATIKFVFKQPIECNSFTIKPMNFATNAYYSIKQVDISDGISSFGIDIPNETVMDEYSVFFDIPSTFRNKKIRSITFYLQQSNSYALKYTVAYYRFLNNKAWLDITGKHVIDMAKTMGSNFNEGVSQAIKGANNWILNYWAPNIQAVEDPYLDTSKGQDGYRVIGSNESKRKRYVIGIQDIKVSTASVNSESEIVTKIIDIPIDTDAVQLQAQIQGNVSTFMSFDDGITWRRIKVIGSEPEYTDDYKLVPYKLFINSEMSLKRKINSDWGELAFVDSVDNKLRLKFVLIYENNEVPMVKEWKVNFLKERQNNA